MFLFYVKLNILYTASWKNTIRILQLLVFFNILEKVQSFVVKIHARL
jgi:hypothetical protein